MHTKVVEQSSALGPASSIRSISARVAWTCVAKEWSFWDTPSTVCMLSSESIGMFASKMIAPGRDRQGQLHPRKDDIRRFSGTEPTGTVRLRLPRRCLDAGKKQTS